jgi:hypothetical protein
MNTRPSDPALFEKRHLDNAIASLLLYLEHRPYNTRTISFLLSASNMATTTVVMTEQQPIQIDAVTPEAAKSNSTNIEASKSKAA